MSLLAALAALAWEHARPRRPATPLTQARRWQGWLLEHFNAGKEQHGILAWLLAAALPALILGLMRGLLADIWSLLAWALDVVVLYLCLGFRPGMAQAVAVAAALLRRETEEARRLLLAWRPGLLAGAEVSGLSRQLVEETLKLALGRLFAVLFWFLLLGAPGAALYLLGRLAREVWRVDPVFAAFALRAAGWMEWLPARLLAFSFAIVGNFQDAMDAWRSQARAWGVSEEGCVLAAGAGALGVRLGGRLTLPEGELARPDLGVDEAAGPETLAAAEALIWRAVVLWLAVVLLVWLGGV